jgi:hypothetical protein
MRNKMRIRDFILWITLFAAGVILVTSFITHEVVNMLVAGMK